MPSQLDLSRHAQNSRKELRSNLKARLNAIIAVNSSVCICPLMIAAVTSNSPVSTSNSTWRSQITECACGRSGRPDEQRNLAPAGPILKTMVVAPVTATSTTKAISPLHSDPLYAYNANRSASCNAASSRTTLNSSSVAASGGFACNRDRISDGWDTRATCCARCEFLNASKKALLKRNADLNTNNLLRSLTRIFDDKTALVASSFPERTSRSTSRRADTVSIGCEEEWPSNTRAACGVTARVIVCTPLSCCTEMCTCPFQSHPRNAWGKNSKP
mmetsp:Transcript_6109/g.13441  ORF Transcript_6109/g.13441 Transcript_6109/m.13441 type:complete len:274 (-) Transcript_6109:1353-2174(-)